MSESEIKGCVNCPYCENEQEEELWVENGESGSLTYCRRCKKNFYIHAKETFIIKATDLDERKKELIRERAWWRDLIKKVEKEIKQINEFKKRGE